MPPVRLLEKATRPRRGQSDGAAAARAEAPHPATVRDEQQRRSHLRRALRRFALSSIAALLVVAAGTVLLAQHVAREEMLRDALRTGEAVAEGIVAPLVDQSVRDGDAAALAELDRVLSNRMADGSLVRVKVWSEDGVVLWSDDDRLIGQQFDLGEDEQTLRDLDATAEISELDRDENLYEQQDDQLVEVYVGVLDASGSPLLFEAYLPTVELEAESSLLVRMLLPLTLGSLVVLLAAMLPFGILMARRVDRAAHERTTLLRHAVAASALERRRIAGDLHDGVVQDLAGIGYALPAITAQLGDDPALGSARAGLCRITSVVQRDLAALRSVIIEIYPANLREGGLAPALEQLASHTRRSGVQVDLDVTDEQLPIDSTVLAYRVVREALRNVVRHAQASTARVVVEHRANDLVVRVEDDGRGFDGPPPADEGHVGLQLLVDTVRDLGGTFDVRSTVGQGTTVEARFPIEWANR